jgi:hypothetical protein
MGTQKESLKKLLALEAYGSFASEMMVLHCTPKVRLE